MMLVFKYLNGFSVKNNAFNIELNIGVPLGISFIIFHLIAFLMDYYNKKNAEIDLKKFLAYLYFFPHMIAGPIVYYKEITEQFKQKMDFFWNNCFIGLLLFSFGLFKKVIISDSLSFCVDTLYNGNVPLSSFGFLDICLVSISFSFQIYFDFSGYSDMAIGLAKLFQIDFPLNFDSPYKSMNFIEFWRRWHISLSNFFKEYLYIPLGGNKKGFWIQQINVLIVMTLCGMWHGSTINFIIWGFLHGVCLIINRVWLIIKKKFFPNLNDSTFFNIFSLTITFGTTTILWIFFRSPDFNFSISIIKRLLHLDFSDIRYYHQIKFPILNADLNIYTYIILLILLLALVMLAPNSNQVIEWLRRNNIFYEKINKVSPLYFSNIKIILIQQGFAIFSSFALVLAILFASKVPNFIYFKF